MVADGNDRTERDVIGLDIGGSKTHGIRISAGKVVAEATAASANVQNVSAVQAGEALARIFADLGTDGVGHIIAGAGGVDTDDDARHLASLIQPFVPGARIDAIHDTRLILAAGGATTGIALIAGTGSVAWGTDGTGRTARSGGWGYVLGDEGSGYWIGREAVRHALRQFNRGQQPDSLTHALLEAADVAAPEGLIAHFHNSPDRHYLAAQSRLVFDAASAGHQASNEIVDDAAAHLGALVADVADQLELNGPVVGGGGLAVHQALLQARLAHHLGRHGLEEVRFLDRDPVYGVLRLLEQARQPRR
ncbi:N-acetylglucosamine kinase [Arthrobacter monumenti]